MEYKDIAPSEAERGAVEATIKAWRLQRAERLARQKEVDALQKEETAMKSWLINVFATQHYEGMVIDQRFTGLTEREVHSVTDREALQKFILETEALDILQFRISDSAIFDREAAGIVVPGVEIVITNDLSDRKV